MTTCLLAVTVGLLCWPVPRLAERRLRALAAVQRVAAHGSPPGRRWTLPAVSLRLSLVCAVAAGLATGVTTGPAVGAAVALTVSTAAAMAIRVRRRRRAASRDAAISAALRLLCAELQAGSSIGAALEAAAHVADEWHSPFLAAAEAAHRGDDPVPPLRLHGRPDCIGFQGLLAAWQVAGDTGTPLVAVLSRVEADVAAQRSQARQVAVAVAGARSSAAMLAGLPLLGLGLGAAMGARPMNVVLGSSPGQLLLCVGVLLDVLGVLWTTRVIDAAERR